MYCLILKSNNEVVDRIQSSSLEQAILFFKARKQLDEETFDHIYDVEHRTPKTK